MTDDQKEWEPEARDYPATRRKPIKQDVLFQRQFKGPDGRWHPKDMPISDRDVMTLNETYGYTQEPEVGWRVLRIDIRTYVDEVIGDGEGETSGKDLLARNEQVTEALKKSENPRQPSP